MPSNEGNFPQIYFAKFAQATLLLRRLVPGAEPYLDPNPPAIIALPEQSSFRSLTSRRVTEVRQLGLDWAILSERARVSSRLHF
jgi:hypothetical protein